MWPKLEDSFVPSRYKGMLTVFLDRASDLGLPLVGRTDPYVSLCTSTGQVVTSKRDLQTSETDGPGLPIWREAFELNCISPLEDTLEIMVSEGSRVAIHGPRTRKQIGRATISLSSLLERPNQQVNIKLKPQVYVLLDLSYAKFVDNESTRPLLKDV